VGGTRTIRGNVRILAATNKDLAQEVRSGRFRQDLHYRLNVINVALPPLRQRKADIPLLIEHFLHQFRLPGQPAKAVSEEASALLVDYPWPGNVRELANTTERLVILSPGPVIGRDDLPPNLRAPEQALAEVDAPDLPLGEMERRHILRVLERTQGKKAEAARLLGIHLKTLNRKLKQYRISR
ncbi:MAG: sigma-54-dependent Fis family transcriptional regulator, partial [Candidatus Rokubacteria bacterium]|nr:sigma-54-dependent Fis family transcriptional regulator [Candidatus Rokubacteria bacterium]